MSLFPHNETPKPRALLMFILGWALIPGGLATALAGPVCATIGVLATIFGAGLIGWFGMEYFAGEGPRP